MRAANARTRTVVEYGPDPAQAHVLGLMRSAWSRIQGRGIVPTLGADDDPSTTWGGATPYGVQMFGGLHPATADIIANGDFPDLSSGVSEGTTTDPARRIFATRMRRRQAVI